MSSTASACSHDKEAQIEIEALKAQHPDKRVMLIAEKGTMGVGSSRMSGVNNVALCGSASRPAPTCPSSTSPPIVAGTNGISPIFLTTVGVTGGIGIDLKNWVKKDGTRRQHRRRRGRRPVLEQVYSVETGTVLTINTEEKKLYNGRLRNCRHLCLLLHAAEARVHEGRRLLRHRLRQEAADLRQRDPRRRGRSGLTRPSKEISHEGQGLTAVEKIFNKNAVGTPRRHTSCTPAPTSG